MNPIKATTPQPYILNIYSFPNLLSYSINKLNPQCKKIMQLLRLR